MSVDKLDFNKVRQEEKPFSVILNQPIQKINDLLVIGLYCYLCTLPPTWKISRPYLMQKFNIGRDKLERILKILNKHGLIEYVFIKDAKGKFVCMDILVKSGFEFVDIIQEDTDLSTDLQPAPLKTRAADYPGSGKSAPYIINNIYKINKKKKKEEIASRSLKTKSKRLDLIDWGPGHPTYDSVYGNP